MKKSFPARIHVLLARDALLGVVFRRGPSKHVCSFLWDRVTNQFSVGQWLHGRIYERRCDISPNGRFLIYFAMDGKWQSETGGSWTAVSRAPWLKAFALYSKGDCWEGGGLFLSNNRYWVNDRYFSRARILSESHQLTRAAEDTRSQSFGAEDTGIYYPRLQRDGWTLCGHRENGAWNAVTFFEKPLASGWVLRKIAHEQVGSPPGKGCYWDEHELIDCTGKISPCPSWEWADVEGNEVLWAEGGCIYRAVPSKDDARRDQRLLHDFNAYKFEPIEAPY
jgi:hypothetical protein